VKVYVVVSNPNCWDDGIDSIWSTEKAANERSSAIHGEYAPQVEEFDLFRIHHDD